MTMPMISPRMVEFLELWGEVEARDKRIQRLEEINAQLAARIDQMEAEKRNDSILRGIPEDEREEQKP